jgi:hypothetical protein
VSRPVLRDRRTEQYLGIAGIVIGSALLYDAYENRGRSRPWWLRWLPGP